jgi:hypothetical protein
VKAGNGTKLIVRNVAFETTKRELRELFGAFGQLKTVRIPQKFDGNHRGFVLLFFSLSFFLREVGLALVCDEPTYTDLFRNSIPCGHCIVLRQALVSSSPRYFSFKFDGWMGVFCGLTTNLSFSLSLVVCRKVCVC